VRDTKLEKTQHEATARHQGGIQKSLRDLHKTQEREQRDAQRAKDEVARLNSVVGTNSGSSSGGRGVVAKPAAPVSSVPKKQATVEDRKRQMEQLAAMGVAIPEEYRRGVAMVGDWQVVGRRTVAPAEAAESESPATGGERKRKLQDGAEEEEEEIPKVRKGWGRSFKSFSSSKGRSDDIGALLNEPIILKNEVKQEPEDGIAADDAVKGEKPDELGVKNEVKEESGINASISIKTEDVVPPTGSPSIAPVVFKKRKGKAIKEK
jgi:hypothetical protein